MGHPGDWKFVVQEVTLPWRTALLPNPHEGSGARRRMVGGDRNRLLGSRCWSCPWAAGGAASSLTTQRAKCPPPCTVPLRVGYPRLSPAGGEAGKCAHDHDNPGSKCRLSSPRVGSTTVRALSRMSRPRSEGN